MAQEHGIRLIIDTSCVLDVRFSSAIQQDTSGKRFLASAGRDSDVIMRNLSVYIYQMRTSVIAQSRNIYTLN